MQLVRTFLYTGSMMIHITGKLHAITLLAVKIVSLKLMMKSEGLRKSLIAACFYLYRTQMPDAAVSYPATTDPSLSFTPIVWELLRDANLEYEESHNWHQLNRKFDVKKVFGATDNNSAKMRVVWAVRFFSKTCQELDDDLIACLLSGVRRANGIPTGDDILCVNNLLALRPFKQLMNLAVDVCNGVDLEATVVSSTKGKIRKRLTADYSDMECDILLQLLLLFLALLSSIFGSQQYKHIQPWVYLSDVESYRSISSNLYIVCSYYNLVMRPGQSVYLGTITTDHNESYFWNIKSRAHGKLTVRSYRDSEPWLMIERLIKLNNFIGTGIRQGMTRQAPKRVYRGNFDQDQMIVNEEEANNGIVDDEDDNNGENNAGGNDHDPALYEEIQGEEPDLVMDA